MNMDTDIRGGGWHPYLPTEIPAPGETLRETLESLDMSQSKLASRTGLTLKHINQIIQGNAAISPETSLALERVTGVEADFWNSLESRFQDHRVREEEAARLGKHEEWLQRMPLSALRKLGYIHSDKRKAGHFSVSGQSRLGKKAGTRRLRRFCNRQLLMPTPAP
jgi:HTH-type transcriptional regulator/antitoxin HigA